MIIPLWAFPGRSIIELANTQTQRSGTVVEWRPMAGRSGLFPLVQWSLSEQGISFANPDWITPPIYCCGSTSASNGLQIGSTVRLIYPDTVLGDRLVTVTDFCADQVEVMDDRELTWIYSSQEFLRVEPDQPSGSQWERERHRRLIAC